MVDVAVPVDVTVDDGVGIGPVNVVGRDVVGTGVPVSGMITKAKENVESGNA